MAVLGAKGGVGTTCTVLGLAEAAAQQGLRVCALDLDPRATLTTALEGAIDGPTLKDVLRLDQRAVALNDAIVPASWQGIWLSPAERTLQNRERDMGTVQARARFRQRLDSARPDWDLILIDLVSGLGNLTLAGIVAADVLLITSSASQWAVAGVHETVYTLDRLAKTHPATATLGGVAVTLYDGTAGAKGVLTELSEAFGHLLLSPPVPRYAAVHLAAEAHHMPLRTYAHTAPLRAREALRVADIYTEFLTRMLTVT
ncbi:ParA family protein (plasmid) [Nonomuraea sp. NBC_00507]|uniref:ParA family protein n=1 Tax=Nonomuraea sp. NBC_00507 TaxID=2976002 RepID=UPI002E1762A4